MSLINCPNCGKPLSDKALKCPHCGYETKSNHDSMPAPAEPVPAESVSAESTPAEPTPVESAPAVQVPTGGDSVSLEYDDDDYAPDPWYMSKSFWTIISVIIIGVFSYFAFDKFYLEPKKQEALAKEEALRQEQIRQQEEQLRIQEEQRRQAKIEEYKNFTSRDLGALRLHGRVRKMIKDGYLTYNFSKDGVLKSITSTTGERYMVEHTGNDLKISYPSDTDSGLATIVYSTDNQNRLVKEVTNSGDYGGVTACIFSHHDKYGNPTECEVVHASYYLNDNEKHWACEYSNYDECNNWRSEGYSKRVIEYYPQEDF